MTIPDVHPTPPAAKSGCLLIHGYGGSVLEMAGLADAFAETGVMARAISLPGHGDDAACFRQTRFADWLNHAESELESLTRECGHVALAGLSMGGVLALNLAARYPVACIAVLATPLYILNLFPWPLANISFYGATVAAQLRRLAVFPRREMQREAPQQDEISARGYTESINVSQLASFRSGCRATRALLPRMTAPLLIVHDARDKLVYPGNAWEIARRAGSRDTELRLTRIREDATRRHVITTHPEVGLFVRDTVLRFCLEKGLEKGLDQSR